MEELIPRIESVWHCRSREGMGENKGVISEQSPPNWTAINGQNLLGELLECFFKFKFMKK